MSDRGDSSGVAGKKTGDTGGVGTNNGLTCSVYCVLCVENNLLIQLSIQLTVLASWSASFALKRSFECSSSNDFMRLFTSVKIIVSGGTC